MAPRRLRRGFFTVVPASPATAISLSATVCLGPGSPSLLRFPRANGGDAVLDRNLETPLGPSIVVEVWKRDLREPLPDRFFYCLQVAALVRRYERERLANLARASSSPNPVDVTIRSLGHIEV